MAFPNLVPKPAQKGPSAAFHTAAVGVPASGPNTFNIGLNPAIGIDPDKVVFDIFPLGPSVTGAFVVNDVNPETGEVTISFTQFGADPVRVECQMIHTHVW